jgi:hypothetical protein
MQPCQGVSKASAMACSSVSVRPAANAIAHASSPGGSAQSDDSTFYTPTEQSFQFLT